MNATLSRWAPQFLSLLRIVAGLAFLEHGLQKLIGFPTAKFLPVLNIFDMPGHGSLPTLLVIASIIEVIFGILLVIGLWSRLAAFIASGEMAVAYWYFHYFHGGFFPTHNNGDGALLLCFIFLYVVFAGPGPWSVDASRERR
jgi:putative oxidoreductase